MDVEIERSNEKVPIRITENKDTQPVLGLNWLDKLEIGLKGSENTNFNRNVINDERRGKIIRELEFDGLFKNNHTRKDLTIVIRLKKDFKPKLAERKTRIQYKKARKIARKETR